MSLLFKNYHMQIKTTFLAIVAFLLVNSICLAQKGSFGIGLQYGDPSGLSLKFRNVGKANLDILGAWDWDDRLFVNVHWIYEKRLGSSRNANFFYGPGLFMAYREYRGDDYIGLGISGTFGLNVYIDQFELFAQLTPRLLVVENTDGDLGGGIGMRFYF
jgi:hypothetical protein